MFRRDGEVLRLGTAIGGLYGVEMFAAAEDLRSSGRRRERGLMHETPCMIKRPGLRFTV
jgi:hypothetical protein